MMRWGWRGGWGGGRKGSGAAAGSVVGSSCSAPGTCAGRGGPRGPAESRGAPPRGSPPRRLRAAPGPGIPPAAGASTAHARQRPGAPRWPARTRGPLRDPTAPRHCKPSRLLSKGRCCGQRGRRCRAPAPRRARRSGSSSGARRARAAPLLPGPSPAASAATPRTLSVDTLIVAPRRAPAGGSPDRPLAQPQVGGARNGVGVAFPVR
jgi:hypothetical protein